MCTPLRSIRIYPVIDVNGPQLRGPSWQSRKSRQQGGRVNTTTQRNTEPNIRIARYESGQAGCKPLWTEWLRDCYSGV
jgi:hypothetical protein